MTEEKKKSAAEQAEEVIASFSEEASSKTEDVRDAFHQSFKDNTSQLQDNFGDVFREQAERARNLVGEGNRRTVVFSRNGRTWTKLPLSVAVVGLIVMLIFSFPATVAIFIIGLLARVELRVESF